MFPKFKIKPKSHSASERYLAEVERDAEGGEGQCEDVI